MNKNIKFKYEAAKAIIEITTKKIQKTLQLRGKKIERPTKTKKKIKRKQHSTHKSGQRK